MCCFFLLGPLPLQIITDFNIDKTCVLIITILISKVDWERSSSISKATQ